MNNPTRWIEGPYSSPAPTTQACPVEVSVEGASSDLGRDGLPSTVDIAMAELERAAELRRKNRARIAELQSRFDAVTTLAA